MIVPIVPFHILARRYLYCRLEGPLPEAARREALFVVVDDERKQSQLIENLNTDRFYATEIGLVQGPCYQGDTSMAEFPVCQREECA